MAYKIFFFDEVKEDIKEAKRWYKKQSLGIEKRFAKDIKNCIISLTQNPYAHAVRYKQVRIAYPLIFPYAVRYYINETNAIIVITAVVHNSRNPYHSEERL